MWKITAVRAVRIGRRYFPYQIEKTNERKNENTYGTGHISTPSLISHLPYHAAEAPFFSPCQQNVKYHINTLSSCSK